MNNKEVLKLFQIGTYTEIFKKYLVTKNINNNSINEFINKSDQIYNCLSKTKKDIGMLVGKVQSGKTTVFSGVIAKYFDNNYDICIILTSIENLLNNQTNERMKTIFCNTNPTKVNVFNFDEFLIRNSARRIQKVTDDLKKGNKYIITILKNKQIDKLCDILTNNKIWKNKKILIIDDEADLASTGSNDINDSRFANNAIKNLLEKLSNYNYLSVTATPQAQVLISNDDAVKPKHVFTYNPGIGYMGLDEFFSSDKYFNFIDGKFWESDNIEIIPDSLKEAVIRYFINVSYFNIKSERIEPTTMLIHTSIAIENHYQIMRLLIKYKNNLLFYLNQEKNSIDYIETINKFKTIFDKYYSQELTWDDDYIELLKQIINYTNINIINSESDDTVIENINNIVLGSKKVERGVTLDNLLLTYITNFHEGSTAVDTILQRARWFGYRKKIENCLTIYITPDLYKQYKEYIMPSEDELWKRLKEAEEKDDFVNFEKYISLNGKSSPTNKVKTKHSINEKTLFYDASVVRENDVEKFCKKMYDQLIKHEMIRKINLVNRLYKGIIDFKFDDFINQFDIQKFCNSTKIDKYFLQEIINKSSSYGFIILFMDDAWENNYRERTADNNRYQLFEGANEDTGFPGEQSLFKINGLENKIIVSLHKIKDKKSGELKYYISLHLPKDNDFNAKYFVD